MAFETGILISVDSTDAKAGAQQVNQALQSVGDAADKAGDRVNQSMSEIAASTQKASKAFDDVKARVEALAGIREFQDRSDDIKAYGDQLDKLRARFNPLFAAQQQYKSTLSDINQAQRVGALSLAEHAAAIQRTKDAFAQQVAVLRGGAGGGTIGTFRDMRTVVQQAGFQVGDFATQIASGQSAMVAFTQQGSQMLQFFGPLGAAAGAALAIFGAIAIAFKNAGDGADDFVDSMEKVVDIQKKVNDLTLTSDQRSAEQAALKKAEALNDLTKKIAVAQENLNALQVQNSQQGNLFDSIFAGNNYDDSKIKGALALLQTLYAQLNLLQSDSADQTDKSREALEKLTAEFNPAEAITQKYIDRLRVLNEAYTNLPEKQTEIIELLKRAKEAYEDEMRAINANIITMKDRDAALVKEAQSQIDAVQAVEDAAQAYRVEAQELAMTDKERAISIALRQQAANIAKVEGDEQARLIELIRKEAGARYDASQKATTIFRAQQDAAKAAGQAEAAMILDPTLRREREVAIDRQIYINELTKQYGTIAEGTGKELLDMWDQATASREQARFFNDIRRQAQDISRDISDFLVDGFVNAEKGGKSAFRNIWDGALAGAKRFAARLAATLLEQKIILPISMSVVGSIPGLFGIASPAGQGGGSLLGSSGGGIGDVGSILDIGKLIGGNEGGFGLGGIGGWIDGLGTSLGFASTALGPSSLAALSSTALGPGGLLVGGGAASQAATAGSLFGGTSFSGFLGGAGLGFGAGSLLNSLVGGNQTGGMIGSGVGALGGAIIGSIVPGIGTILGGLIGGAGGGLLGGLFGPGKSVGPNANAGLVLNNGQFGVGASAADNGGDVNAAIQSAQQLAQALNTFNQTYGLQAYGSGLQLDTGNFKGQGYIGAGGGPGVNTLFSSNDPDALAFQAFKTLYGRGNIGGAKGSVATVLGNSQATSLTGLASDLDFAKQVDELAKSVDKADVQTLSDALKQITDGFEKTSDQFAAMAGRAQQLGIDMGVFTKAQAGLANQQEQAINDFLNQTLGPIEAFRKSLLVSNISPLSPAGRLAEAKQQFLDVAQKAQSGDLSALQSITGFGQQFLQQSLAYNASGAAYQEDFRNVNQILSNIETANSGGRDLAQVFLGGTADVTNAVNQTGSQIAEKLDQLDRRMRDLAATIRNAA